MTITECNTVQFKVAVNDIVPLAAIEKLLAIKYRCRDVLSIPHSAIIRFCIHYAYWKIRNKKRVMSFNLSQFKEGEKREFNIETPEVEILQDSIE